MCFAAHIDATFMKMLSYMCCEKIKMIISKNHATEAHNQNTGGKSGTVEPCLLELQWDRKPA